MTHNDEKWKGVARKGVFEVLSFLEPAGEARFNEIYKGSDAGCIATLAAVLKMLEADRIVEKKYYTSEYHSEETLQPLKGTPGVGQSIVVKYAITPNGREILGKIREIKRLMSPRG